MAPKPAWENLDEFFSPAEFAVPVSIAIAAGSTRAINAIFDDPYINPELGEVERDMLRPTITAKESDLFGVRRGMVLTIGTRTFRAMGSAETDGTGVAVLTLAEI